ncbi:MAG: hypothetical protein FJ290_31065 [Planctomycetes bacterium]|nr:hypothetical protein [Planctomycetota bacterium]
MRTIYLVACVSEKKQGSHAAKDSYDSAWFKKARAYVERQKSPWFILSAEHGLLDPESRIEPYEKTLNEASVAERRAWAARVIPKLREVIQPADCVVFLAGERYREFLIGEVRRMCAQVLVPMERLAIGRQLQWLTERTGRLG